MAIPYAEVIGDPIGHSKSPLIHKFWLEKLGIAADYRGCVVQPDELPSYLERRCCDRNWRGCNVTAPLKQIAADLAVDPTGISRRIGAVNAIVRSSLGCAVSANTDLNGVAEALHDHNSLGNQVCIIGAGGAARAALEYLRLRDTMEVSMIVRDVAKAQPVHRAFVQSGGVYSFAECEKAMAGAEWVINATPMGMEGMPPLPDRLLYSLAGTESSALVFDMVYSPVETPLLRRAVELGRKKVDGLTMLIGQAAPAFELFFGMPAPRQHDDELRRLLYA